MRFVSLFQSIDIRHNTHPHGKHNKSQKQIFTQHDTEIHQLILCTVSWGSICFCARKTNLLKMLILMNFVEFMSKGSQFITIGGSKGAPGTHPQGSKFFHFHAVFGKKLQNKSTFRTWRTPQENPGSATDNTLWPPIIRETVLVYY